MRHVTRSARNAIRVLLAATVLLIAPGTWAQTAAAPPTQVSRLNPNQLLVKISAGDFQFHGALVRTTGNSFVGSDGQYRVSYDRAAGRIVVINEKTGAGLYDYAYSDVNASAP